MNAKLSLLLILVALVAGACNKELNPSQKQKSTDLVVPGDFDWKTSQDLKVTVTGLALPVDYVSTLKISRPDGQVIFTANYSLKETLSLNLTVPTTVSELTLTYGKRTITSAILNGKVDFAFMQKDDQSDLGK